MPLEQPLAHENGPLSAETVLVDPFVFVSESVYCVLKVAVIVRSALIVTAHVSAASSQDSEPVPDQPRSSGNDCGQRDHRIVFIGAVAAAWRGASNSRGR